jgi:tricarballylate dehydrogenase
VAASSPTATGCARPGARTKRGEWPADNFLIRGTRFNQGVLLRTCWTIRAPTPSATRRRRTWWPSTRARRCTTAASAPGSTACRWAWWSTSDARRFYDEGEDFWPKRYAIWGRLVAQQPGQIGYSIIDAKAVGRFMPPVFPGEKADSLPELARKLGLDEAPSCRP